MERQGLLKILEENRVTSMGDVYTIRIFELTDKGHGEVSELVESHKREHALIKELLLEYGNDPLDRLLNYVHTAYSPLDL